jgi:hypothetical protein
MQENYKNRPVIIIGLGILFLIILSFIPGDFHLGPFYIKSIDLFMDVKPDSLLSQNIYKKIEFDSKPIQLSEASLINFDLLLNDLFSANSTVVTSEEKLSGNVSNMKYFFDALNNADKSQVRIAHFGDSEIEGDMISADIRQAMQGQFGGNGAGFLSITSQDIAFRASVKHTFSGGWSTSSVFSTNSKNAITGINGSVSTPGSNAWVQYETVGRYKNLRSFNKVRIFYSDAKSSASISYSFNNKKEEKAVLKSGSAINELVLTPDGDSKAFKFTAPPGSASFYGVSLEGGNGVYLDNFPLRGNTGVSLRDFSPKMLKDFNKLLDYKLIILSFGLNIISSNISDFTWYEKEMIKVVNLLKSTFPQASILIIGVGDKGVKKGSAFVSDPDISRLVEAQRNIAAKSGVTFWNLYKAMGGENSMTDWVNAKPALALKDYTHVNLQGAEKIAEMLSHAILEEYKKSN